MLGFCDVAHTEFCAESATLHRIWGPAQNRGKLANGTENAKILLIFVNHLTVVSEMVQHHATHAQQLYRLRKVHDCTCNTDTS